MTSGDSFSALIDRLRRGDSAAAELVFRRFTHQLIALARGRLDFRISHKTDPEELVQSAYGSFFRRFNAGECNFDSWDSLWGFLALLTLRKCLDCAAYHRAACRDVGREQPLPENEESLNLWAALSQQPSPLEVAVFTETVESFMAGWEQRDRDILSLHLQGFTIGEISQQLGRAQRTVRRTIARAKHRLRRLSDQDAASSEGARGN